MEYDGHFVDDTSGQKLDTKKVIEARKEEMNKYLQHNAYGKVPIEEAWRVSGEGPIGSRGIDSNKGDDDNPEYRSRLVAKEINRSPSDKMIAATPTLEAKKMLFSMAVTEFANNRAVKVRSAETLIHVSELMFLCACSQAGICPSS